MSDRTAGEPNPDAESETNNAPTVAETSGGAIPDLMDLLADEAATWEEVEAHLQEFPGWLRILGTLRYPTPNAATRTVRTGSPMQYDLVGAERRKRLADIFRPYAILLDLRLSSHERAARLRHEIGVDPVRFCREHLRDGSPQIRAAAQSVLEASAFESSLLRSTNAPAVESRELLRTSADIPPTTAELLTPAHADETEPTEPNAKLSFWQRLRGRKS